MSQCETILAALRQGRSLTPIDALNLCGSLALHSRISEIRARLPDGEKIECELVEMPGGKRVGRYRLVGQLALI